ncbi:MAG: hypothetical protein HYS13_24010, partial [Planctomycetia bacterium]|nr:hypothetical protein [Planctomycetia bacterium]
MERLLDTLIHHPGLAILWIGLTGITIALLVLMRTSWGRERPLRKCVALSLLAHAILVGYAATVKLTFTPGPPRSGDLSMRVQIVEDDLADEAEPDDLRPARPWEQFPSESTPESTAAATAQSPPPVADDAAPQRAAPDVLRPDAQSLRPIDADPSAAAPLPPDKIAGRETPSPKIASSPQEIEAPAPKRQDDLAQRTPGAPVLRRPDNSAGDAPSRSAQSIGLPSPLVEDTSPVPRLSDPQLMPAIERPVLQPVDPPAPQSRRAMRTEGDDGSTAAGVPNPATTIRHPDDSSAAAPTRQGAGGAAAENQPDPAGLLEPPSQNTARARENVPEPYKLRVAQDKQSVAEQSGGSPETETAVKAALKWLADNQDEAGHWDARRHGAGREKRVDGQDRQGAGARADSGITGLALLAFLGGGHTHLEGDYQPTVRTGLEYLIRIQARDGNLSGNADTFAAMYCHGMAALALAEAYGLTHDPALERPLRRALAYTISAQHPRNGGWRYQPGDARGDTSQLGWQLMALKSGELAGVEIPQWSREGMQRFLLSVASGKQGGLASYREGERTSRPMTAEAL